MLTPLISLRFQLPLTCLLCVVLLSSCFEVIEEVTMKADGSGSVSLTVNLSQSKTELSSIMLLDTVNGYQVPQRTEISSELQRVKRILSHTDGISNVKVKESFDDFIFSVKFDFKNTLALNNAISIAGKTMSNGNIDPSGFDYFSFNGKQFKRSHNRSANKHFKQLKQKDRKILDGATYTSIFRFAKPITHYSNPRAKLSKSKQALFLKSDIKYLFSEQDNIDNTISF